MLQEYFTVFVFLVVSMGITLAMFTLAFLLGKKPLVTDLNQTSPYECGFDPFLAPRSAFYVQFYLVSLLFIIFDLEVAFLFPWALSLESLPPKGFWSVMIFLGILTLGFVYEWKKKAFKWE